jgi:hypothetical protein
MSPDKKVETRVSEEKGVREEVERLREMISET